MSSSAAPLSVVVHPSAAALAVSGGKAPLGALSSPGQGLGDLTAESLFASMMAGLLASPSLATPVSSGGETSLQFGGKGFNFDPALLVVPSSDSGEGSFDLSSLLSSPFVKEGTQAFPSDLLKSLTAGVPQGDANIPLMTATLCQNADGTTTQETSPANPLLPAMGLSPVQMEELRSKLSSLAKVSSPANQNGAASGNQLAMISFTDPSSESVAPRNAFEAFLSSSEIKRLTEEALPVAQGKEGEVSSAEFDPVEFRIAQKSAVLKPFEISNATAQQAENESLPKANNGGNSMPHPVRGSLGQVGLEKPEQTGGPKSDLESFVIDPQSGLLVSSHTESLLPAAAAGPQTALTNPLLHNSSAIQAHPALQAVATLIHKAAKKEESQSLAIQLDPPELGRLNVKMQYEAGEPLKVHIVLEKADTMAMFLRDSHALQTALDQAGLKTDNTSLSFEVSQDGSAFQQALGGGQNQSGSSSSGGRWTSSNTREPGLDQLPPLETTMGLRTDPATGLTRYNVLV